MSVTSFVDSIGLDVRHALRTLSRRPAFTFAAIMTLALRNGATTVFTMPRAAVMRTFVLNHLIHHRGQLSVYLRLRDIPVPGTYGPSADSR